MTADPVNDLRPRKAGTRDWIIGFYTIQRNVKDLLKILLLRMLLDPLPPQKELPVKLCVAYLDDSFLVSTREILGLSLCLLPLSHHLNVKNQIIHYLLVNSLCHIGAISEEL